MVVQADAPGTGTRLGGGPLQPLKAELDLVVRISFIRVVVGADEPAKDHVNLFLYDGAIVPDPEGIITGGHGNKAARMISFYEGDRIKVRPLTAMLKKIIANNRATGRRKLKTRQ